MPDLKVSCLSKFGTLLRTAVAIWIVAGVSGLQAKPLLEYPADCAIGERCWILSFVDLDAGPAYHDHKCGARTYAAHKGTDIALYDAEEMILGIPVRAAAAGIVLGTRDGTPDNTMDKEITYTTGQECGNGVRLDHGDGWATQYCHLRQGSISVKTGQSVDAGTVLGTIGNSGASETPHLHFQVEQNGEAIDPFTGRAAGAASQCGEIPTPLWSDAALAAFGDYQGSFIRLAGFAASPVTLREVQGSPTPDTLSHSGEALVFYTVIYGAPAGATLTLEISDPTGGLVVADEIIIEETKARYFRFIGKRTPDDGWPKGAYRGIAHLVVEGEPMRIEITPVFLR